MSDTKDLPTIPTYPEFAAMINNNDVLGLHSIREHALFYKALADSWERRFVELCSNDEVLISILKEVDSE